MFAVAAVAVILLYFGIDSGVRAYVSERIAESEGRELGDFELPRWRGGSFDTATDAAAGRYLVLNFFRSQCTGCRMEAPEIRRLAASLDPDKALVLGILMDSVDDYFPPEVSERTLADLGYGHPVLVADRAFVDRFHGAGWKNVTPVTYVLGPDRTITASFRGHRTFAELVAALPADALRQAESGR